MLRNPSSQLLDLFFPSTCAGCSTPLLGGEEILCITCLLDMPYTRMHDLAYNAIEMRLFGRFEFQAATALLFFMKNGRVQQMMHELKYLGAKEVGAYLGARLADVLQESSRFGNLSYVVPVPLHPRRQRQRGYNQVEEIGRGMEERGFIQFTDILERVHDNSSQTRKGMAERWKNVQRVFELKDKERLRGKKVLLLDDVLTTGATLEACAHELLKIEGIELYVATIACAEY